ncbi:MAG: HNH endonuclease [Candidatus Hodarchaeota archaeon]
MDSVQSFEMILQYGSRDTTYKFGLLLGIVDYVIENPLQPAINNFHFIPVFHIAKQFLAYYYPLITDNIRQGPVRSGKKSIKLEKYLEEFKEEIKEKRFKKSYIDDSSSTHILYNHIMNEDISEDFVRLIYRIRKTILDQPLQYIRNLKGEKIGFFGLLAKGIPFDSPFEDHRKAGLSLKWNTIKEVNTWETLEKHENCFIFVSHQTYEEISSLRFWLRDVLIKRWSQECVTRFNCSDSYILSKFDLWKEPPERDSGLIRKYRQKYTEIGLTECIYCKTSLTENNFHLDHFIPWIRFPINRFWNLYPVCPSCNSKKQDKIPLMTKYLTSKIQHHLNICINNIQHILFSKDLHQLYRTAFNSEFKVNDPSKLVGEIFEYILNLRNDLASNIPGESFEPISDYKNL